MLSISLRAPVTKLKLSRYGAAHLGVASHQRLLEAHSMRSLRFLSVPREKRSPVVRRIESNGPEQDPETFRQIMARGIPVHTDEIQWIETKTFYANPLMATKNYVTTILRADKRDCEPDTESNHQAVVILATPSFVSWLDDLDGFVRDVIRPIMRNAKPGVKLDVICACVDGVGRKPQREIFDRNLYHSQEGFSILHAHMRDQILPPGDRKFPALSTGSRTLPKVSSIVFGDRTHAGFAITVPLANTLFKNGKLSTLELSVWKIDHTYRLIRESGPEIMEQIQINIFNERSVPFPSLLLPAIPLTTPREIGSGLGNIVRTIKVDNQTIPASKELEMAVENYTQISGINTVEVWAMVIPRHALITAAKLGQSPSPSTIEEIYNFWDPAAVTDESYIGDWIARGATLSRVLSGGGGYAAKEGLLSLDPNTEPEISIEPKQDYTFNANSFLAHGRDASLGTLAQAGSYIQFFAAIKPPKLIETVPLLKASTAFRSTTNRKVQWPSYAIGVNPLAPIVGEFSPTPNPRQSLNRSHFGCVSASAIFLRRDPYKLKIGEEMVTVPGCSTKLDIPFTYVHDLLSATPFKYHPALAKALRNVAKWQTWDTDAIRRIVAYSHKYHRDRYLRGVEMAKVVKKGRRTKGDELR